ncbi:unnamed protein product [Rotaria sp. Silwood2]|nr:unnamed protein product [Rotaria sp. Silwood2]
MVDFQGVCLQRQIRSEKSSGHHFRGILQTISIMLWNIINHLAMILIRNIIYFPQWSYATIKTNTVNQSLTSDKTLRKTHSRESLSNILLTHIDFRHPILHHKILNSTKDDETIDKVPEACIEEFNLYVSTWKGWRGPLPSKDNKITWEQVERDNTIYGTVNCTPSVKEYIDNFDDLYENETNDMNSSTVVPPLYVPESYSYSISKIPKSNLMLIYANHSKEASLTCEQLIIKRKPVEFTNEEWCTRLKTTPYRERPHKCFFVHEGEKKPLFSKCSNANRLNQQYLFVILPVIIIELFFYCTKKT